MKEEDKNLLLEEIGSRLPYKLKVRLKNDDNTYIDDIVIGVSLNGDITLEKSGFIKNGIDKIKLYLYHKDSLPDFLLNKGVEEGIIFYHTVDCNLKYPFTNKDTDTLRWFLKNHVDFKGLLTKGLAMKKI